MLKVKGTILKNRFNIVDVGYADDEKVIRQVSKEELISIIKSGVDAISGDSE